jgi:uncharacterized membrane protein YfcA
VFEFALDLNFLIVGFFSVVLTGISKSGLGGGLGQLSVPLIAMFVPPAAAVAIMLPILCFIDVSNIWRYRKNWDSGNLVVLLPGAVIGIGIGALLFRHINDNMLRLLLGSISLVFALTYFLQRGPLGANSRRGKALGLICGALSGFTSFVAHAGGGPMKIYLLPQRLDVRVFVGTHVYFFFFVNQLKIWPYMWLGQFSPQNLGTSLMLMPAVPLGVWLGWRLVKVIEPETFYKISYALLFVVGLKLICDGLSGAGYL